MKKHTRNGQLRVDSVQKASTIRLERTVMMSEKKMVGRKVMALRKEQGYSRDVFAARLGIPSTTLRNYELGIHEPGHSFIIQMAKEFCVSTDYLLGLSEDRRPQYPVDEEDEAVTEGELEMIRAFRRLDAHGKKVVRWLLEAEGQRMGEEGP